MKRLCHRAFLLLASVTLAAGCGSERVAGVPSPVAHPAAITANVGTCRFSVKSVSDLREESGLGNLGRTRVGDEGFRSWFENGIAAIPGYQADTAPRTLRIEVIKAYVQGLSTMKSANLVVRVYAIDKNMALPPRVYRGVDNSGNFANTESEIQAALDRAMYNLRLQIGADIDKLCKI
jgi:hypothetical protein